MREFTFKCSIDGNEYTPGMLAMVRYHRDIHLLHEMKRAGAAVVHEGRTLSHDDINLLVAADAFDVSVAVRRAHGPAEIRKLFKAQLQASAQRWREMNAASEGLPLQTCVADLTITGITFEEFSENMKTQAPFLDNYPALHPDHFFVSKEDGVIKGVETFGMYGGPSELHLSPVQNLSIPIERDESYPFAFGGVATLPDGMNANAPAFMQFKPLDDGLAARTACCLPAKAPKEMVEGHKLHLALEFFGFAKAIASAN